MNDLICYHNGNFKKESDVQISFKDLGFLRAHGVFDYLRTYNEKPFLLSEHVQRFLFSAHEMFIDLSVSAESLAKIVLQLLDKNEKKEYGIKLVATGGINDEPTLLIYCEPLETPSESCYIKGVALSTLNFERDFPFIKHNNYQALITEQKKIPKDIFEILYLSADNHILECGTSNIFIINEGTLVTPVDGILKGCTRNFVIDMAHSQGLLVEQRSVSKDEMFAASEVFITASKKEIIPVTKVDDRVISEGVPGELSLKLLNLFRELKKQD